MDNLLLKYMNERASHTAKKTIEPGPVITISRECGCSGKQFAEKLTHRINKQINDPSKSWKLISKEILNLASDELKINPEQVRKLLKAEEKNFLDEIVSSFTDKYYVHDAKIKVVIEEVIRNIAKRGKAIILGRGSEVLTSDIPRSLHVKLFAPKSWRIEVISERWKISHNEAKRFIDNVDKQRSKFRDAYLDKNLDPVSYDFEFNCAKFNHEEIIELIMKAVEIKSLL